MFLLFKITATAKVKVSLKLNWLLGALNCYLKPPLPQKTLSHIKKMVGKPKLNPSSQKS